MAVGKMLWCAFVCFALSGFDCVFGGYVITTSRSWVVGEESNVCISLTGISSVSDHLLLSFEDGDGVVLLPPTPLALKHGGQVCHKIKAPEIRGSSVDLHFTGSIGSEGVDRSQMIDLKPPVSTTFVETDKYIYKPSQVVNIRILTVGGPLLKVSTEKYPEIWIENPGGARLKQWLDVNNTEGLVHLSYKLSDEPAQGTYIIKGRNSEGHIDDTRFKIEEYVLPRFEVTILPPSYLLGSSKFVKFDVCARYTFGQPLKGTVKVMVGSSNRWNYRRPITIERHDKITECRSFRVSIKEIQGAGNELDELGKIHLDAEVTEEGTDVTLSAQSVSVELHKEAVKFKDLSIQKYFKPGLPFLVELATTFPDGTPAANELMAVCAKKSCETFSTNSRGLLKFALPPHIRSRVKVISLGHDLKEIEQHDSIETDESDSVETEESDSIEILDLDYSNLMDRPEFYKHIDESYFSPSNSSLAIGLFEKELSCLPGKQIEFHVPVHFSAVGQTSALVNVQVTSRGKIQFSDSIWKNFDSDFHGFNIDDDLFIESQEEREDDEGVTGFFIIPVVLPRDISPKAKILVWYARDDGEIVSDSIGMDVTKCLPNDVSLSWSVGKARPGQDESLTISAAPNSLCSVGTVDKSVLLLASENEDEISVDRVLKLTSSYEVFNHDNPQLNEEEYCRNKLSKASPAPKEGEEQATPSNSPETTSPYYYHIYKYYSDDVDALSMFHDAGVFVISDLDVIFRQCKKEIYRLPSAVPRRPSVGMVSPFPPNSPRTYFPETWLWDLVLIPESGSLVQKLTLPDTVTEWVGKAVCVHPSEGVGVSDPSSITTFRDFFVDLTLPPTAKRGEVFPVKISVFNYLGESLPVKLSMLESAEFDILADNSNALGSGVRKSCIPRGDKVVHSIKIRPKEIGDVNITIDAIADVSEIANCGSGNLVHKRDTLIKPIRVEFEGFPKEEVSTEYLCPGDKNGANALSWSLVAPPDIVQDSGRGFVSVVGDMMGPTIEHLGHLVRMPYGCGEQNMVGFAPNIFVMQYLEASKQATKEIISKATTFMESGYKRELNYRHKNGSYSAFGESDPSGSTWLTAFVLKCFSQAKPYIEIDEDELILTNTWLKGLQGEDGCFASVGKVLNKRMKGGIGDSRSLLTSFVLISLLESGEDPSGKTVADSLLCLNSNGTSTPYSLAVKAYALALAGKPSADKIIKELLDRSVETSISIYWDTEAEAQKSEATALETAGYAVLALLTANPKKYRSEVAKIVKSINNKRNGQGGFISTQDTIVSLQALAEYEKAFPQSKASLAIEVDMNGSKTVFNVNERNKLLLQKAPLPSVPANVSVAASGSGCALVQAVLRYNVPKPDASEAFSLRVEATTEPDKGCKTKRIKACASYRLADLTSNMAIIDIDVMTGYIPDKADLKAIVGNGTGDFKRYEVDGGKVLIYVDEFSSREICASFKVLREFEVEEAKNGTVSVYDYYSPEYLVSESYRLPPARECQEEIIPPPIFPEPSV